MDDYSLRRVQNSGWDVDALEKICKKWFEQGSDVNYVSAKDYSNFESFFDEVIFRLSFSA
jgi:hypothetical protein